MKRNVNWAAIAAKASGRTKKTYNAYPETNENGGKVYYTSQCKGKKVELKKGDTLVFA